MTWILLPLLWLCSASALASEPDEPDPAPILDLDDDEDFDLLFGDDEDDEDDEATPESLQDPARDAQPDAPTVTDEATQAESRLDDPPTVVAIVPLDGVPGTSFRDLEVFVRGLAEAMAVEPQLSVVSGSELVNRLTEGNQRSLLEARDAMTEGVLLLAEGDPDIGISFLEEAVAAHDRAGSAVARREEMADSAFALAKAWLETGKRSEAAEVLALALRLVPDYLDVHPDAIDADLRELAREVEVSLFDRPPRRLSRSGAQKLGDDLQADRLIHGLVQPRGDLSLSLYDPQGNPITTVVQPGPFQAPRLGDPKYESLARPLVAAALGQPHPTIPDEPPPPEKRKRGGAIALGVTLGLVAAGLTTAGILYGQTLQPPKEAWQLQVRVVR
ncbi:MAG: hypothetical protein EA397_18715 [Deltaproteobacteria bacterium]|nr:MAG: hypothetical protein EA397_18715 [Deltaproteobacteria bacterium]